MLTICAMDKFLKRLPCDSKLHHCVHLGKQLHRLEREASNLLVLCLWYVGVVLGGEVELVEHTDNQSWIVYGRFLLNKLELVWSLAVKLHTCPQNLFALWNSPRERRVITWTSSSYTSDMVNTTGCSAAHGCNINTVDPNYLSPCGGRPKNWYFSD